ncbi:hypothetical protein [Solibacillus sp. FSL H8-0538]|uniref:hypothetical protein n=1 Tax=Solibacillus sp. FSL H8-0538 TaxID=2921400 RepID=UPI0030F9BB2E
MKRLILPVILLSALLGGCGKGVEADIGNNLLYSHSEPLMHEMEGVLLEMSYEVSELQNLSEIEKKNEIKKGSVNVAGYLTLRNGTESTIYYTPSFFAETSTGQRFGNIAEQLVKSDGKAQFTLEKGEELQFRIAFNLSKSVYKLVDTLEVTVPVAFKEPNSVSSGDALGDTTIWELPIKE